jgi:hypothetical protein
LEVVKTNLQATLLQPSGMASGMGGNKTSGRNNQYCYKRRYQQNIPRARPLWQDTSSLLHVLQSMFRGCFTKTLYATSSSFCYFFLYSFLVSSYHHRRRRRLSISATHLYPSTRLLLSAVAAVLNTFITLPLDVLSSQRTVQNTTSKRHKKQTNTCDTAAAPTDNDSNMNLVWNELISSTTLSPSSLPASSPSSASASCKCDYKDAVFHEPLKDKPSLSSVSVELQETNGISSQDQNSQRSFGVPMNTDTPPESLQVIDLDNHTLDNNKYLCKKSSQLSSSPSPSSSWAHLWKGLTPALMLCMNPAIHYTVYDICKNRLLMSSRPRSTAAHTITDQVTKHDHHHRRLSMSQSFLLGLMAKFVATVATYPLIRAKVILMVTSETSLWATLVKSYQNDDGLRGLYKGCDWQLFHTLLKSALMMMVRERITEQTNKWIIGGRGEERRGEEAATKTKVDY